MVLRKTYDYDSGLYPPVIAVPDELCAARSLEVDSTKVSSYAGADGKTQRILAPGCFAGTIASSSKVRALPRTTLAAALTASSTTTFAVAKHTARNFIAGETLKVISPYQVFTFAGTWAAADVANAVIDGYTVTTTAVGSTLSVEATAMAAAINADRNLARRVVAIASGAKVYVYAYNMRSLYTTTASETTAGDGTFAAGGAAMAGNASIGTISSVDVQAETITLTAASSLTLPIGMKIGVISSNPFDSDGSPLGVISPQQEVDLEWGANNIQGLHLCGTFLRALMPYIDGELEDLFPEIQYV